MEIKDRISIIIKSQGLNAGTFAEKIGVQRSNVSHILNGRNKPGFEFIEKILIAFPKVSADWLITGRQKQNEAIETPVISSKRQKNSEGHKIVKITVLYDDFTFDVYEPNAQ